ncbi:MAG TPA: Uma2 family endonuclease [Planctomycetales bacterium]|jgi:Uma2 family endonuclease|nr:Uma2 family endonuclease [Planctomycetales bacterium]
MSTVEAPAVVCTQPVQRFVLHNVSWEEYGKFLEAIGENHVRVTYDRGSIEFMSPQPLHERYKHFFSLFFLALSKETGVKIYGMGSTTFRRRDAGRGLEPDECYYLQSAARVRDLTTADLTVDPPPDLAIEVDITSSVLNRMEVYASLGIPEVWRCDGQVLEAYCLGANRCYERTPNSAAFPFLPLDEVLQLIQHGLVGADSVEWLEAAQEWLREDVLPRRQDS